MGSWGSRKDQAKSREPGGSPGVGEWLEDVPGSCAGHRDPQGLLLSKTVIKKPTGWGEWATAPGGKFKNRDYANSALQRGSG